MRPQELFGSSLRRPPRSTVTAPGVLAGDESSGRPSPEAAASPEITVLICTHNRASDLNELLATALAQDGVEDGAYEVLVVDNNSSDGTRALVEEWMAVSRGRLRYRFEGRQGKPYALNCGIEAAWGEFLAVIDDDQLMPPTYIQDIRACFHQHPEATFIGGKVLPIWEAPPPPWLGADQWGAIGMVDYGDDAFAVSPARDVCLVTCVYRRQALLNVGGFAHRMFVSEDAEVQKRLYAAGGTGMYVPTVVLHHKAAAARLTRRHYLNWSERHGRSLAVMRDPVLERSRARLLDVPVHMYRQAFTDVCGWLWSLLRHDDGARFECATRLRFFRGFFRQRLQDGAGRA